MNITAETKNEVITFDGYDGLDLVVKRINIWRDYENRGKGVVCSVKHEHQGILLERQGDACKVRTTWMGVEYEGWVTYWFIKELKAQWQLERILVQEALKKAVRSAG